MPNYSARTGNHEPDLKEVFADPITMLAVKSSGNPMEYVLGLYENTRPQIKLLRGASSGSRSL